MKQINRRDFIKLTGTALGGVILACSGCNWGGGSSNASELPNGYRFYRLKSAGDRVGGVSRSMPINRFGGSVHISSNGIITFDAYDSDNRQGMFQLDVDLTGSKPTIDRELTPLLAGDTLADQRKVNKFTAHDVNDSGNIAAVLHADGSNVEQHYGAGLYLHDRVNGFLPVMICGNEMNQGRSVANGIIGDVALSGSKDILVIASHTPKKAGTTSGRSMVHLPGASLNSSSHLMTTGDYVNGTEQKINGLGIVDINDNGNFAVSSHTSPVPALFASSNNTTENSSHCILSGHIASPNDHLLFAAAPAADSSSIHVGELSYGPRIGADGTIYTKIGGVDGNKEILVSGSKIIRRTDEPMPSGEEIFSFTPGSLGSDGTFFYTQYVKKAGDILEVSLIAYNGNEHRSILTTDNILSDGGPAVRNIIFSTTTNHIDNDGRIVLLCEFTDNSTSLVIGIPA